MARQREGNKVASYYTVEELRARSGGLTASGAQEQLRRIAKSADRSFDMFLSHSFQDAQAIVGLRNLFTDQGVHVYVDWIDDPELDRSHVSSSTAVRLRERMRQSKSLVYATSRAANSSRWMPWELGYFDGIRGESSISIMPVEDHRGNAFDGQEYLGLYKVIEKVRVKEGIIHPYAVGPSRRQAESLGSFARGQGRFEDLVTP
jgi:hypothetical protein